MGHTGHAPLAAYIAFQLTELEGQLPLIATADPEAVHNARLALRRLRSVLSCYRGMIPRLPRQAREEVDWLATSLGESRDAYVLAQRIRLSLDTNDSWKSPEAVHAAVEELEASSARLAAALGGHKRSKRTVRAARAALLEVPAGTKYQPPTADLAERLQARWERLQHSLGEQAGTSDPEVRNAAFHQARKDVKCLRYSVEAIADAFSHHAFGVIQPAIGLQRVLGEQHDAVVATEWIRELADNPGIDSDDARILESMEVRRRLNAEEEFRMAIAEYPVPAPRRALIF
ncbi:CHAD domain-containing protein [Arthrobacter bambusae]|uniref:CHAD domain-containing protein n=1 Tax=Arthrobacter bambusae TaxID=1338426 RepID=UPI002782F5A1|nr:CHAD domain-containing protein [Arthrobacter bambusae]MDQ0031126.1 CHAD domain-containing protein [Arthrobacter bambusae]MDQ0099373.1 CHAD domain-containing protein [Arthrobacter bambusae]